MSATLVQPDPALVARLHELYHDSSKHSVYQSVPAFVARALGYQEEIHSLWRSDAPRLDFITAHLDPSPGARLADIGANTGYFTLNLAERYPDCRVVAYEMNPRHAEFIRLTATAFALNNAEVQTQSCNLVGLDALPDYDVVLLLNVLHHAGFDFDPQVADHNAAFAAHAVAYLSKLRRRARRLVFQIGSNRGGDKARPVHPRDDDAARLAWNAGVLSAAGWRIDALGYASLDENGAVVFRDVPTAVLAAARAGGTSSWVLTEFFAQAALQRFPGEFHRRPLIIASAP